MSLEFLQLYQAFKKNHQSLSTGPHTHSSCSASNTDSNVNRDTGNWTGIFLR